MNLVNAVRGRGLRFWLVIAVGIVVSGVVTATGSMPTGEDASEMYLYLNLGFLAGLALFEGAFGKLQREMLIKNTPTSKVRSIAMGLVEVYGKAKPVEETLRSPFSAEDCLFYKYEVEEYRRSGKHAHWVTVDSGTNGTSFYIDDGTGQVLVDPREADLKIPSDNTFHVDGGETPPKPVQGFIQRNEGLDSEDEEIDMKLFSVSTGNDRRYTEYFVTPGEEVYVFGEAMERPQFRGSSRNEENIVINKDDSTPMFLISDESEKELLSDMKMSVVLGLFGGGILAVGSFAIMLFMVGHL